MREDDPTAQYAQMLHVEQQNHPSLHIVPAEPALYVHGIKAHGMTVGEELKELEEAARFLGGVAGARYLLPHVMSRSWPQSVNAESSEFQQHMLGS